MHSVLQLARFLLAVGIINVTFPLQGDEVDIDLGVPIKEIQGVTLEKTHQNSSEDANDPSLSWDNETTFSFDNWGILSPQDIFVTVTAGTHRLKGDYSFSQTLKYFSAANPGTARDLTLPSLASVQFGPKFAILICNDGGSRFLSLDDGKIIRSSFQCGEQTLFNAEGDTVITSESANNGEVVLRSFSIGKQKIIGKYVVKAPLHLKAQYYGVAVGSNKVVVGQDNSFEILALDLKPIAALPNPNAESPISLNPPGDKLLAGSSLIDLTSGKVIGTLPHDIGNFAAISWQYGLYFFTQNMAGENQDTSNLFALGPDLKSRKLLFSMQLPEDKQLTFGKAIISSDGKVFAQSYSFNYMGSHKRVLGTQYGAHVFRIGN